MKEKEKNINVDEIEIDDEELIIDDFSIVAHGVKEKKPQEPQKNDKV